ncbi:hypothetical protein [Oleiharenicola lentus]|uniref:hypothetical protein n=1 Tax=Oleiharenicola lentus TaxID=2508720 RepID=UPI003F6683BF
MTSWVKALNNGERFSGRTALVFACGVAIGALLLRIFGAALDWWKLYRPLVESGKDSADDAALLARLGQFGDSFGGLNSFFQAATIMILILAFTLERLRDQKNERQRAKESAERDADAKRRNEQHAAQLAKMAEQTAATLKVLQFDAKKYRLEYLKTEIADCHAEIEKILKNRRSGNIEDREQTEQLAPWANRIEPFSREYAELHNWFKEAADTKI